MLDCTILLGIRQNDLSWFSRSRGCIILVGVGGRAGVTWFTRSSALQWLYQSGVGVGVS